MPISYSLTQRVNLKDVTAPRKYYAVAKSNGEETVRQLATEISKRSGLSSADVFAVIESFIDLIPERIADGKIVRLGDFGSFSLTLSSDGTEKIEEFNSSLIKGNSLNFRPGKIVQKVLDTVEYSKVSE
jgi:DNA-binding protein, histone-like, putative